MIDLYEQCITLARIAAKPHNYAVAVHGSCLRDLDLVLIPWEEEAPEPATVILAIISALQFEYGDERVKIDRGTFSVLQHKAAGEVKEHSWASGMTKPHGRASMIINIGASFCIDLSVMPRASLVYTPAPVRDSPFMTDEQAAAALQEHRNKLTVKCPPTAFQLTVNEVRAALEGELRRSININAVERIRMLWKDIVEWAALGEAIRYMKDGYGIVKDGGETLTGVGIQEYKQGHGRGWEERSSNMTVVSATEWLNERKNAATRDGK